MITKLLYKNVLKPLLFTQDPELVHDGFLKFGDALGKSDFAKNALSKLLDYKDTALEQEVDGVFYKNPIGLAAGFDKNARLTQMITGMIFEGPQAIGDINRGLVKILKDSGFNSIRHAVGTKVL